MKRIGRATLAGVATLCAGLLLAAAAASWQAKHNREHAEGAFDALAQRVGADVSARLALYEYGLRAVRGAAVSAQGAHIGREAFRLYTASRETDREFPGARGFGVIWRVPQADEVAFVERAGRDGWPDFKVRQMTPHDGERFVIELIEPVERNDAAVGLDVASEANRREAALTSMRSGQATLTGPITLVQVTGKPLRSFLVMLPIYRPGVPLNTVAQREAAAIGWSYAPLVTDEVLHNLDSDAGRYSLSLRDKAGANTKPFYSSSDAAAATAPNPKRLLDLPIYGRTWEAELRATPAFMQSLALTDPDKVALVVALIGALCSILVTLMLNLRLRKRSEHFEQARRAAIVAASEDAIIGATLDGVVNDWNGGAERLFGHTAAQALGRRAGELVVPEDRMAEEQTILDAVSQGQRVAPFNTLRRHRDGTLIDVSMTAVPILTSAGRCLGIAMTVRDMRAERAAQQALAALNTSLEQQVADRTARLADAQRATEALLSTVHQHAIVSTADRNGRITEVNDAFCAISGYSREELIGQNHRIVNSSEQPHEFWAEMWRTVAQGKAWRNEVCNRAKDGTLYWVDSIIAPFVDAQCKVEKYISIRFDISARRQMEAELRVSNARMSLAAGTLGLGVWEYDLVSRSLVWDERMYHLYGREGSGDQEPYTLWSENLHPEDRARSETELQDAINGTRPFDTVFRIRLPDGSIRYLKAAAHVERDASGRALRMIGVNFDVTERMRADLELRNTMTLLNAVLESATQASIIAVKPDGLTSVFNAGAQQMLGYGADEVVGKLSLLDFHDSEELRERATTLSVRFGRKIHADHVLVEREQLGHPQDWNYRRKDGGVVPVSLAVTAMRDASGELFGYLGIAHDVSRQKQQERALQHAVEKAKNASLAKSQFLANMSHEIRTPMNAVIGLSYLLERTPLNAEQADTLGKIKIAGKSLLSIINDVLDLSKIEASEMQIESAPFVLANVLSELTALSQVQADAKGVGFTVNNAAELPKAVVGDATRLRQVLTNLLSNAIKFTERGAVQLNVELLGQQEAQVRLRFAVKDSGIGIAPEALQRLFNPFVQADTSTTRRFGGTGLGLSIVKQLVTLMGGEVGVNSALQQGSEFWVELDFPLCGDSAFAALEASAELALGAGLSGVRVLVVDDSAINLEVARRILELEGAQVWLANNGQEAVDHLLACPQSVDVVLMDVQMPVLDGHDATRRIRSGLGLTKLPVIALTAGISTGEQGRAAATGMNDVVAKPFDPQTLVRCICKYVSVDAGAALPVIKPDRADWPQIDGIDARDASTRLRGDVALFISMLRRLLLDFGDLAQVAVTSEALVALAARMHNLKGSAGTLGAKSLAQLAAQAERTCRAGTPEPATPLMRQVVAELEVLGRAARPILEAVQASEGKDEQPLGPLNTAALDALLAQLACFDLKALQSFKTLAAHLHQLMGADAFRALSQNIDNLEFSEAASALRAVVSSHSETSA